MEQPMESISSGLVVFRHLLSITSFLDGSSE
jgi:hypothetical protein